MRGHWSAAAIAAGLILVGCGGAHSPGGPSGTGSASSPSSNSAAAPGSTAAAAPTNTTPAPAVRLAGGLALSSPAFKANLPLPAQYTCDGRDISPPLEWSGVPASTRELVLVMRDPDAPGGNFVHWALAGISPQSTGLPAGSAPSGAVQGINSFGTRGYRGPCPPPGDKPHHYVITLSALGAPSGLPSGFSPDKLATAAVAIGTLIGTYARH